MAVYVVSLDTRDYIKWARSIARGVRADFRFTTGGHEELEMEGTALEQLVVLVARFDESRLQPGDDADALFRAMAGPWIRKACKREAERIRNGGLYRTAARAQVIVGPLPESRCDDSTEIMISCPEPEEEEPEPEPVKCRHEPTLVIWRSTPLESAPTDGNSGTPR